MMALLLCRTEAQGTKQGGTHPVGSVVHARTGDWTHTAHETQLYYFFEIADDPAHTVQVQAENPDYGEDSDREDFYLWEDPEKTVPTMTDQSAPQLTWAHLIEKLPDGSARWVVDVDAVAVRIFGAAPSPQRTDYERKHAAARERSAAKQRLSRAYREWFASNPPTRERGDMWVVRAEVAKRRNYTGTNRRLEEFSRARFTDTRQLRAIKDELRILDDRDFEAQELDTGTPIEIFESELVDRGA